MIKKTLSIGLIGSGFMGKAHVYGFATAQKVFDLPRTLDLHTIADINSEAARRAAQEFGVNCQLARNISGSRNRYN